MRTYSFEYLLKGSRPTGSIQAANHEEASRKIQEFLRKKPGASRVKGSVRYQEYGTVPEEVFAAEKATEAFFAHKALHPNVVPPDQQSHLSKKMQSGGPGRQS
jgi:hypothetical protein